MYPTGAFLVSKLQEVDEKNDPEKVGIMGVFDPKNHAQKLPDSTHFPSWTFGMQRVWKTIFGPSTQGVNRCIALFALRISRSLSSALLPFCGGGLPY